MIATPGGTDPRSLGIEPFDPAPLPGEPPPPIVALSRLFFELGTLAVEHGADPTKVLGFYGQAGPQLRALY